MSETKKKSCRIRNLFCSANCELIQIISAEVNQTAHHVVPWIASDLALRKNSERSLTYIFFLFSFRPFLSSVFSSCFFFLSLSDSVSPFSDSLRRTAVGIRIDSSRYASLYGICEAVCVYFGHRSTAKFLIRVRVLVYCFSLIGSGSRGGTGFSSANLSLSPCSLSRSLNSQSFNQFHAYVK